MDENKRMVLGALATLYQATGRGELADQYYRQASQNGPDWYGPLTCINYHKLKEALDQRGIKLVCVQYPVRSIESLRQVFSLGEQNEIIFVDNEEIFKAAIKSSSYHEYFVDIFCGDFGHCTPKGNKLLAENIAKALAQAEFKK